MRELLLMLAIASIFLLEEALGKRFEKCELATVLETKYAMPKEDVKNWVCIAQYESTFNTEAINHSNWDGSKDYGLFQLNNKYWCDAHYEKNECNMPCSDLLDDDLTDDLKCINKIIKDTEAWKGKGTGLTAWVAYVNRCQNRNLDEYMSECWSDPLESNIINRDEESANEQGITENEDATSGDSPIINLVRVPIMYQSIPVAMPMFQHLINPYGYFFQQRFD